MIDVALVQRNIKAMQTLDSGEKLPRAKELLALIHRMEKEIAADFSVPFDVVKQLKDLIPEVQATINRCQARFKRAA